MRILLLNYEFPPLGGGAATASAQIAAHLARRGVDVAVLTSHFKGLSYKERHDGYTIYRVNAMRRNIDRCSVPEMGGYILGSVLPALRIASSFRPDLMLVFFGMPTGPVGLLVNKLKGIPYVLSLRGGDVPGFMGKELARMHGLAMPVTKRVWSAASAIVVNSEGLHQLAQRTVPDRTVEVVPNGIDLDLFCPVRRAGTPGGKVRLLFVGRLANQKGLPYLLQALAGLEKAIIDRIEVELVGSGPEEARLRSMSAGLDLSSVVRFAGWVPRVEIVEHYQRADVFVLPSLDEGMPNVVLEAMACGMPILATDIRGNRELVQDNMNGLLVPTEDVESLVRALRELVTNDGLRARMGEKSRALVGRYSWSSTADRYLELSKQIVGILDMTADSRSLPLASPADTQLITDLRIDSIGTRISVPGAEKRS